MRIGILGFGAATRNIHLPALRKLRDVTLVGASDADGTVIPSDIARFDAADDLLDKGRPDVVIIATPTATHFPLAAKCLRAGVNVFCEKPFTTEVPEALELIDLALARNLKIAVNNEFRFMACHEAARKTIDSAEFGQLSFVSMNQTFVTSLDTESGWRGTDLERTCKDFGTHVFDLSRYFFDCEPITLRALMPRPMASGGPDLLNLIDLEFPGDRFARITLDRLTRGRHRYLDIRLDGDRATVETELGGHAALEIGIRPALKRPYVDFDLTWGGRAFLYQGESRRKIATDPLDLFANATSRLLARFLQSVQHGGRSPCDGADNVRTLALMRKAYEAAATRREIDLSFLNRLT